LTDTLTYTLNTTDGLSVTLDYDSVKLYKVIDGKNILCNSSDWVWTASTGFASNNTKATRTISATVDDETSYVLEYAYTVDYEKIPSSSTVTKTTTMDNTVRLYSDNSASTSNSTESKWSQSGASGGINSTYFSYTFTKVQSGNYGNQLEGAIFGLYYLNGSPVVDTDGTDITYTTDSKGKFVISKTDLLTTDTVYYVKEIKPPVGYKIPDDAQSYYFYFKENGLADSAPTGTVDLSSASQAVSVPNALIPTYELPETGGTGRHRGLAVGIALIAASTILLWRRKKNPSSWI
jgi:LPXTG-motif cell wall-anchored protein